MGLFNYGGILPPFDLNRSDLFIAYYKTDRFALAGIRHLIFTCEIGGANPKLYLPLLRTSQAENTAQHFQKQQYEWNVLRVVERGQAFMVNEAWTPARKYLTNEEAWWLISVTCSACGHSIEETLITALKQWYGSNFAAIAAR